jgi:hypothetical protein
MQLRVCKVPRWVFSWIVCFLHGGCRWHGQYIHAYIVVCKSQTRGLVLVGRSVGLLSHVLLMAFVAMWCDEM